MKIDHLFLKHLTAYVVASRKIKGHYAVLEKKLSYVNIIPDVTVYYPNGIKRFIEFERGAEKGNSKYRDNYEGEFYCFPCLMKKEPSLRTEILIRLNKN